MLQYQSKIFWKDRGGDRTNGANKELCPSEKRKDETSTKRATRMEIKVKKEDVSDRQNP